MKIADNFQELWPAPLGASRGRLRDSLMEFTYVDEQEIIQCASSPRVPAG